MTSLIDLSFYDHTTINPIGLAVVVILGIATLFLPRRSVVLPFVIMACFIAPAQRIVAVGFDFTLLRILLLFGMTRIALRNEWRGFVWRPVDSAMVLYGLFGTIIYFIQQGDTSALVNRLGWAYDYVGMYFFFRMVIRTWKDLDGVALAFIIISVPVAIFFAYEWTTRRNIFAVFGGVPAITMIRDGRLRCQGAFAHPILAGCFWATVLPLMIAEWVKGGRWRWAASLGITASLWIIFTTSSSTPVSAVIFVIVAMMFYPLRHSMWLVRISIVLMLIALQLAMDKPVWHLLARLTVFNSSTGWYRYYLIDQAVRHTGDWFFFGVKSTESWDALDITNEYVLVAIRGGALTLSAFIALIVLAYRDAGRTWRAVGKDQYKVIMAWALGASVFVHTMDFIAVSYFGQIQILWSLSLAMIGSMAVATERSKSHGRPSLATLARPIHPVAPRMSPVR